MNKRALIITAWLLAAVPTLLAFLVWGQSLNWRLTNLGVYTVFPLFGLLAFSLMWGHYIVAAIRQQFGIEKTVTKNYFEVTSAAVLIALLLHPHLLMWQLWHDGHGLPPSSYLSLYTGEGMKLALALGTISFWIFLAFEFRRRFSGKSWWRFVQYASDIAILAIFYHALTLGRHVRAGWFRTVWFFYGITLVISLVFIYYKKYKSKNHLQKNK